MTDYREVRMTKHEDGKKQREATVKATQIIWLLLGILEAVIALRILFKLIGVNGANPFAKLLYGVTDLFLSPFVGLIGTPFAGNMVLEISSVIAMIVYLLLGWAFVKSVYVLFYRSRGTVRVRQTVVNEHNPQQAAQGVSQTTTTHTPNGTTQQTSVTDHVESGGSHTD